MSERFVVVGAGPAGMAAALTIAEEGVIPVVLDAQMASGGQIWRGRPETELHLSFNQAVSDGRVRLLSQATVLDHDGQTLITTAGRVAWSRLIIATGAREVFLPFPGWTLPGVMGAGGIQAMYKSGLDVKEKRIVVAGSGPLLIAVAAALHDGGAIVPAICEQAPGSRVVGFGVQSALLYGKLGQALRLGMKTAKIFRPGTWIAKIEPGLRVTLNSGQVLDADYAAVAYGLTPNLELPRLLGCRIASGHVETDRQQRTRVRGIWAAGETTGIGGVDAALVEGRLAARSALGLDCTSLELEGERWRRYAEAMTRAYALRDDVKRLASDNTVVCRCEGVSYGDLKGASDATEAKLDHRLGMGWCQGRVCGAACRTLFDWPEPNVRPPLFPIGAAQYANLLADHDES